MDTFILGTAGHIDHGKSSLIKAMTGTETDRLAEEKRRGISIVLGYANLSFSSGISAGIVDVPGHAKFIKTMVSGSTGMNGVLLVIAADDGIMAQTREHLLILKLLGVRLVIPVLTKIDAVSDEIISGRESEISDFLKSYGFDKAPANILKVSVKQGKGISELKNEIETAIKAYNIENTATKSTPTKVFLPIDRIISSKGFGTILAGTLKYGSFSSGDEIQIMPSCLTARIKNIESHNTKVSIASKSMRISVNVPSVKKESVKSGEVISLKDSLTVSNSVLAEFYYDFENKKDLKSHISLTFMTGGASTGSNIIILNGKKKMRPGEYSLAIFKLDNKISTMSKERFIVRDFGAGRTIGGGVIIDPLMDSKYDESLKDVYGRMISDNPGESVYSFIEATENGILDDIYKKLNINYSDFIDVVNSLKKSGIIVTDTKNRMAFLKDDFDEGKALLAKIINENSKNKASGFKKGLSKQELLVIFEQNYNKYKIHKCGVIKLSGLFETIIDELLIEKEVFYDGGNIMRKELENRSAENVIPSEYIETAKKIEYLLGSNGNSVPNLDELEKKTGTGRKILNYLISLMVKQGSIIRIKHDIYYLNVQMDCIKKNLEIFFKSNERLEPKDMKEIAGVSRKYAIPLLEYFDYTGYTLKKEDHRIKKG